MSRRTKTVWLGLGAAILLVAVLAGTLLAMPVGGERTPTAALGAAHYVEEARAAGISQTYDGTDEYAVGGGVAAFDCNDDGRPDLYLAGGANPAALYRNDSPVGGVLRFTRITSPATDLSAVNGAYPIDVDGDGIIDLVVLRNGENVLLRGLGDCRFERANERWSFDGGSEPTEAFSATWERDATLPTLAFGEYLRPEFNNPHRLCYDDALVRPSPSGSGYARPIPLSPSWCTLSMLFSDWDRSGRRDLRVSNDLHYYLPDEGKEQLWRIEPGQPPREYTAADGWRVVHVQGMGIASYDLTGDGYPEYLLTSQAANRLQTLVQGPAQPTYGDMGLKAGVTAASQPFTGGDTRPSTAWHDEFVDVNNDGFVDLFIAKGNIDQVPDYADRDPNNLLLGQPDGTFHESAEAAGLVVYDRGRGAALVDFNLDGLLDLVVVNYGQPVTLWRNVGAGDAAHPASMGHWLALRVNQPGSNRDAIGAWVEVKVGDLTLRRELTVGGGHASGALGWVHFGLGPSDQAHVRVTWPDGEVGPWQDVKADQFYLVGRGSSTPHAWQTPGP